MIEKNKILYLPMDDPDGSSVAYDYSVSRKNAIISGGATFSRDAVIGKSLAFNGDGEASCETVIPLSGDFTLSMYVKTQGERIGWMLAFSGIDNYKDSWIEISKNKWVQLTFIKSSGLFKVFVGTSQVYATTLASNPVGFALCDDSLYEASLSMVDDITLYNEALDFTALAKIMDEKSDVGYFVNGRDFKEFGVYVSSSKGLMGLLERKEGLQEDWGTRHGIMRNTSHTPRYRERTITLECFIEAYSRANFVEQLNDFMEQFRGKGTKRLLVQYSGTTKPLVYEVVHQTSVDPDKEWNKYNQGLMVGTFTLTLIEDDPVKMVLRHIATSDGTTAKFSLTSWSPLLVFWGDGSVEKIKGESLSVTHTYAKSGEYDIIIAGLVEEIESFTTDEILVWQKLT